MVAASAQQPEQQQAAMPQQARQQPAEVGQRHPRPLRSAARAAAARGPSLAIEGLAGAQQLRQVLFLPGERGPVVREARLGLAEGARVVDGAPRAVGDAAQLVVQHLVVHDALEEEARHRPAVEHGVDADEREHRVVAAEGEPAAARAADAAAPGDRHAHAAAEAALVDVGEHQAEVVGAPARHERRQLARRAAHAVQVLVHEAAHLAVGRGAVAADVARERRDDRGRRVQEHAVQAHQRRRAPRA